MDVSKGRAGFGSETTGRLISETGAEGWACKSSTWQHNCLGGGAGTDLSDAPRVWGEGCRGNGRHVEMLSLKMVEGQGIVSCSLTPCSCCSLLSC